MKKKTPLITTLINGINKEKTGLINVIMKEKTTLINESAKLRLFLRGRMYDIANMPTTTPDQDSAIVALASALMENIRLEWDMQSIPEVPEKKLDEGGNIELHEQEVV